MGWLSDWDPQLHPTFWMNLEIKELKATLSCLQTYCWSLWPNKYIFCFIWSQFSLSMWSAASIHQALSYRICSKASILHVSLSANGDAKHAWLWTLTPVFQPLLIHCRLAFWWFLVDSWPSWPIFSEQQVIVCLFFFLIVAVTQRCHSFLLANSCLCTFSWDL